MEPLRSVCTWVIHLTQCSCSVVLPRVLPICYVWMQSCTSCAMPICCMWSLAHRSWLLTSYKFAPVVMTLLNPSSLSATCCHTPLITEMGVPAPAHVFIIQDFFSSDTIFPMVTIQYIFILMKNVLDLLHRAPGFFQHLPSAVVWMWIVSTWLMLSLIPIVRYSKGGNLIQLWCLEMEPFRKD